MYILRTTSLVILVLCFVIGFTYAQEKTPTSLIEQGNAELEAGNTDQAQSLFQQALDLAGEMGDVSGEANAKYHLALAAYFQKDYLGARDRSGQAIVLFSTPANASKLWEVRSLHLHARAHVALNDYGQAEAYFWRAVNTVKNVDDRLEEGTILKNFADLYYVQQKFTQARDLYQKAQTQFFAIGATDQQADALVRLGNTNFWLWNLDVAIVNYSEAYKLYTQLGNQQQQATTLHHIARIYHHRGELDKALDFYNQSLRVYIDLGDRIGEGRIIAALGDIYRQYHYSQASVMLDQALSIQQSTQDIIGRAMTLNYRGEYYLADGNYQSALIDFQEVISMVPVFSIPSFDIPVDKHLITTLFYSTSLEAQAHLGKGRALDMDNSIIFRDALNEFNYAFDRYRYTLNDPWNTRRVFIHQAQAYMGTEWYVQADEAFNQARQTARSVGDLLGEAEALIAHGESYDTRKNHSEAIRSYEAALRILEKLDEGILSGKILLYLGDRERAAGHLTVARERYEQAAFKFSSSEAPAWESISRVKLAQVDQLQGLYPGALEQFKSALSLSQSISDEFQDEVLIHEAQAFAYQSLGVLYLDVTLYQQAIDNLEQARYLQEQYRDRKSLALTYNYLGDSYYGLGDFRRASDYYNQSISLAKDVGNLRALALAQNGIARVLVEEKGAPLVIKSNFEEALNIFRHDLRDAEGTRKIRSSMGWAALLEGKNEEAQRIFGSIDTEAAMINDLRSMGYAKLEIARIYALKEDTFGVENSYKTAINNFQGAGDLYGEGLAHSGLGEWYLSRGNYIKSLDEYTIALLIYQRLNERTYEAIIQTRIGNLYTEQGRYDLALPAYEQALTAVQDTSDDDELENPNFITASRAAVFSGRGNLFLQLGQFVASQSDLDEAEALQSSINDENGLSRTLVTKGQLLLAQQDYDDALFMLTRAKEIAVRTGNRFAEGLACLSTAEVYTANNDPNDTAAEDINYNCALNIFTTVTPNPTFARRAATSFAFAYLTRGSSRQAEEWFNRARNEAVRAQDKIGQGYALLEIGNLYAGRLEYDVALQRYRDARELFRSEKEWIGEGEALNNIARINVLKVNYNVAHDSYQNMITLYGLNGDALREAETYSKNGEVYQLQSLYALALEQHLTALEKVRQAKTNLLEGDSNLLVATIEAYIYRNIGSVQIAQAQYDQARGSLDLALQRAESAGDTLEVTIINHLLANITAFSGDYLAAIDQYNQILTSYQNLGEQQLEWKVYLDLGDSYYGLIVNNPGRRDNITRAEIAYQRAVDTGQDLGNLLMEYEARWKLGRIRNLLGRNDEAEAYLEDVLKKVQAIDNPTLEMNILIDLGLVYEETNQPGLAIETYNRAIALIEDIHADIRLQTGQITFASQTIVPYHRMVVQSTNDAATAFAFAERGRARTFLFQMGSEQLDFGSNASADLFTEWQGLREELISLRTDRTIKQADLETATTGEERAQLDTVIDDADERIEIITRRLTDLEDLINTQSTVLGQFTQVNVADIETVQAAMPEDTTLLVYYTVPVTSIDNGNTYVFVINKNSYSMVPLNRTSEELKRTVDSFVSETVYAVTQDFKTAEAPLILEILYSTLIEPVEEELTTPNLVIVPHGVLNYVSFASLTNNDETFLSDRFTISYAPSATFYTLLLKQPPASTVEQPNALVFGNPTLDPSVKLKRLPEAEKEAIEVSKLLGVEAKVKGDATESLLRQDGIYADIIHIASHGVFIKENPLSTSLALAADAANDGFLEVREIYSLRLRDHAPLVVLSACDTVTGKLSEGDEFQGLTRAFLLSGARAVVASLWQVSDETTSILMSKFYEYRKEGMSDAEALKAAQKFVREQPGWQAPYFWSGFILVGLPNN